MEHAQAGPEGPFFHTLRLELPEWPGWEPGQFVMARPEKEWADLVWGRPFSICRADAAGLVLAFQSVGRGTERLARLQAGDAVAVWGPLGRGFAVEPDAPTVLLAGGIGIAPFVGYALAHPRPENLSLEFGHRPDLGCYPFSVIADRIAARAHQETRAQDLREFIALLERRMQEMAARNGLVLACGPAPFLKTVHALALRLGARTQLSLESRMACGVGACLGCVVKSGARQESVPLPGWPVQVCTRGPVFWAEEVDLTPDWPGK